MVFFTCNVCGEALKKNQVDKHYSTKCRGQRAVSCMDCGKDFWGNDYEQHTKCISEEQKYSGKGYVPKVNKGEAKQDRWIEQVQTAIDKHKGDNRLRGPLESIKNCPNIPRKKAKFDNFLVNSLRIRDRTLISKLWDAIMTENDQQSNNVQAKIQDQRDDSECKPEVELKQNAVYEKGTDAKKLNKRERKEERRKQSNKKEKKDKSSETTDSVENSENGATQNKKKRKNAEEGGEENICGKKRKRVENDEEEEEEEDELEPLVKNTKFNWANVIKDVLKSKGEITLKKLRRKVLAEYISQMGEPRSEEKLLSKFNKKVTKNADFKVFKDRVKLVVAAR